ncbi:DUF1763-domain-containing protein [Aspergillus campestris IBT 28561]|uniref:DUF1763-domain-containing protein n=2 Tax=Aspergillus subgen. Circumdati TaxID=2720871 RepID=A0A2I2F1R7_ASPCN|nr:DUF1763-domain-containing protein [Aspergillus candidus]XP_024689542.1 DUF1763-domain-containing protein [Aspergillus campestris IBT 28561]PKY00948.1 DUF1763-domain-containing protein [Aspergillus campestris IBT 28561]PLB34582.1 DUF1763-domain-containing protein [Aspergillus candidus]
MSAVSQVKSLAPQQVIHAYRHLYRQGLKAINYSTPSRHVLLRNLRKSFRTSYRQDYDPQKIENTVRFLQRASDVAGMEHKIVKNLMIVRYWDQPLLRKDLRLLKGLGVDQRSPSLRRDIIRQFNSTLVFLNESLGTCLK